jgi:acyl-CoA dehydrogenase
VAINDAMDVHGGKGICMGPDNYLARAYQQTPIAITVEGANILTRSLIIFGQGAVRAHPYVLKEIQAAHDENSKRAVLDFDEAFFGHISFALSNAVRSLLFALTYGHIVNVPTEEPTRRYYQLLTRYSASFAIAADFAMLILGGALKRREKLSARLGDVLSQLYLCSAVLKKFEDDGRQVEDIPLLDWAIQDALFRIQTAFDGVLQNFPNRVAALLLRALIFPLGQCRKPPSDDASHEVAAILSKQGMARDRLSAGAYIPKDENEAVGALEAALTSTLLCEPLQAELVQARKAGKLKSLDELGQISEAKLLNLITAEQAEQLQRDYALRRKVIMVDDFAP